MNGFKSDATITSAPTTTKPTTTKEPTKPTTTKPETTKKPEVPTTKKPETSFLPTTSNEVTVEPITTEVVDSNPEKDKPDVPNIPVTPNEPSKILSAYEGKTKVSVSSIGDTSIILPKINNTVPQYSDLSKFKIEVSTDGGNKYTAMTNAYGYWSNRATNGEVVIGVWIKNMKANTKVRVSLKDNPEDNVVYDLVAADGSTPSVPIPNFPGTPTTEPTTTKSDVPNKPTTTKTSTSNNNEIIDPEITNPISEEPTNPANPNKPTNPTSTAPTITKKPVETKSPQVSNGNFTVNNIGGVGTVLPLRNDKSTILYLPSYNGKPLTVSDLKNYRIDFSYNSGRTYVAMTDNYSYGYTSPSKGMYGFWNQGNVTGMWIKPITKSIKIRVSTKIDTTDCIIYSVNVNNEATTTSPNPGTDTPNETTKNPSNDGSTPNIGTDKPDETTVSNGEKPDPSNGSEILTPFNRDGVLKEIEVEPNGNSGIVFPKINGKKSSFYDYSKFHFEISLDGGKIYMPLSSKYYFKQGGYTGGKQYAYWTNSTKSGETVSGIWIREVRESMKVRVSLVSDPNQNIVYNFNVKGQPQPKPGDENSDTETTPSNGETPTTPEKPEVPQAPQHSKTLSVYNRDGVLTEIAVEPNGNSGIAFPKINGRVCNQTDYTKFRFYISIDDGKEYHHISTMYRYRKGGYTGGRQYGFWTNKTAAGEMVSGIWIRQVNHNFKLKVCLKSDHSDYLVYSFVVGANTGAITPEEVEGENAEGGNTDVETPAGGSGSFNKLIWSDEFNGSSLDRSKWSYSTGYYSNASNSGTWGWGNEERQWYSSDSKNVNVGNGALNLVLYNDPKNSITQYGHTHNTSGRALFSSGKVVTKGKFSFKYGRIDVRAKCSSGTGLWPAIWMLPEANKYGGWAASGEIDIFEGRGRKPNQALGTIHYGSQWPGNKCNGRTAGISSFTGYHVYSVEWTARRITWFIDGAQIHTVSNNDWYSGGSSNPSAPFDQNFYIILNLAAGGKFDGGKNVSGTLAASHPSMQVDYVRVYQ